MEIINFILLSLIIYFVVESLTHKKIIPWGMSLLISIGYLYIDDIYNYPMFKIISLIGLGIVLLSNLIYKKSLDCESFSFKTVVLFWLIIFSDKLNTHVGFYLFIFCLEIFSILIYFKRTMQYSSLLGLRSIEVYFKVFILILIILSGIMGNNHMVISKTYYNESFFNLFIVLNLLYVIISLGGFESKNLVLSFIYKLKNTDKITFMFVKYYLIPVSIIINLKVKVLGANDLSENIYTVLTLILFVLGGYIFSVLKNKDKKLNIILLLSLNSIAISLQYIMSENISELAYSILMLLNIGVSIGIFKLSQSQLLLNKKVYNILIYMMLTFPISPLFIYKLYNLQYIHLNLPNTFSIVFIIFLFLPLLLFKFYLEDRSMGE